MWCQPLGGRAMFINFLYSHMRVWRMCDGSSGDRPEPTRSLVLYKRPFVRRSVRPRLRSQFCTAELTEHLWSTCVYCQALQETPRCPVKMVHTSMSDVYSNVCLLGHRSLSLLKFDHFQTLQSAYHHRWSVERGQCRNDQAAETCSGAWTTIPHPEFPTPL